MTESIVIFHGQNSSLLAKGVSSFIEKALNGEDKSLSLDEFQAKDYEAVSDCAAVISAVCTPSMFTSTRVIVAYDIYQKPKSFFEPLRKYAESPSEGSTLVLVSDSAKVPAALKSFKFESVCTDPPRGKEQAAWFRNRLGNSGFSFSSRCFAALLEHYGEDVSEVEELLNSISGSFTKGQVLEFTDLEPFLSSAGAIPIWDLTDQIDSGDIPKAIRNLRRMLNRDRHPLQIMVSLNKMYEQACRLDGAQFSSPSEAASIIGISSAFTAKKAIKRSTLGSERLARATHLLVEADEALKSGGDNLVMEVLVARLAQLPKL